ncbi:NADH-quinone oxidoreductase subunit N [Anatilimnocola floriformis]|uniref:NADH-quinone oxidoreductase subunit N n=1 Tax=Anatilimnocola floriformis TaxID=2948575 RepID=UPI0020C3356C|nr:NADH-quinone oxidoreductase subunit N [Anatilimnocola floriformis]
MNLHQLVSELIIDTKGSPDGSFLSIAPDSSLSVFTPELIICATILLMLLVRLFEAGRRFNTGYIALAGSLIALYFAAPGSLFSLPTSADVAKPTDIVRMEIFTGMLVYDAFSVYVRAALLLFAALFVIFTWLSGIPDLEDGPDIYTLVLGATLGMCLMASANHLLTIFLAVEMASVPSYVLAGLLKGRRVSSEAALKYSIYGAGTAGVMLYGISLLAGLLNTAHLPTMAATIAQRLSTEGGFLPSEMMVLALGGLMLSVGLAFKLSAVPFHFWCPDVFEGATAEVNAFLSVASKAGALALLVRVTIGLGIIAPPGVYPGQRTAGLQKQPPAVNVTMAANAENLQVKFQQPEATAEKSEAKESAKESAKAEAAPAPVVVEKSPSIVRAEANARLSPVRWFIARLVALFAVVTCTFGNLAAYGQNNIKRLFAYSTIAHAGYMLMAIPAVMVLAGTGNGGAERAIAALGIYIAVYLFMNLAAFAVIAFLRNAMRSEDLADYAGLLKRCPLTVICFSLILFSLVGLPPLSGFIGKFAIFASLVEAYQAAGKDGFFLLLLIVIGGLNTAISLFYYLRVVKIMTIDEEPRDRRPFVFSDVSLASAYLWVLALPTLGLIINWEGLNRLALAAASQLF